MSMGDVLRFAREKGRGKREEGKGKREKGRMPKQFIGRL
jgi:hypothetical protein